MAKTKTSSKVKDRYNAKAYDEIKVRVAKGRKAELQAVAERHGQSVNGFINGLIDGALEREIRQGVVLVFRLKVQGKTYVVGSSHNRGPIFKLPSPILDSLRKNTLPRLSENVWHVRASPLSPSG